MRKEILFNVKSNLVCSECGHIKENPYTVNISTVPKAGQEMMNYTAGFNYCMITPMCLCEQCSEKSHTNHYQMHYLAESKFSKIVSGLAKAGYTIEDISIHNNNNLEYLPVKQKYIADIIITFTNYNYQYIENNDAANIQGIDNIIQTLFGYPIDKCEWKDGAYDLYIHVTSLYNSRYNTNYEDMDEIPEDNLEDFDKYLTMVLDSFGESLIQNLLDIRIKNID